MRDDGTAIAAWKACRPGPGVASCTLQRSGLAVSGVWTTPMTMATKVFQYVPVEVASTPDGFTAITWVRRHNGRWRTVVARQVAGESWSREVMGGAHDSLVVGPGETVAMIKRSVFKSGGYLAKGVRVSWRNHRFDWATTTLAPRRPTPSRSTHPPSTRRDGSSCRGSSGVVSVSWSRQVSCRRMPEHGGRLPSGTGR